MYSTVASQPLIGLVERDAKDSIQPAQHSPSVLPMLAELGSSTRRPLSQIRVGGPLPLSIRVKPSTLTSLEHLASPTCASPSCPSTSLSSRTKNHAFGTARCRGSQIKSKCKTCMDMQYGSAMSVCLLHWPDVHRGCGMKWQNRKGASDWSECCRPRAKPLGYPTKNFSAASNIQQAANKQVFRSTKRFLKWVLQLGSKSRAKQF